MSQHVVELVILGLLVLSVVVAMASTPRRRQFMWSWASTASAVSVLLLGGFGLWVGDWHWAWAMPFLHTPLTIGTDALSDFFLVVLGIVYLAIAWYSPAYVTRESAGVRRTTLIILPSFFLSMVAVLLAQDAISFLAAWEGMSLTSFFLVMAEHERATVRSAGFVYLVTTHTGALALLALFSLLHSHGAGLTFADFTRLGSGLPLALRSFLLLLGLVGFGSKAALVPLHVWLPRAHPVAPSPVSALMSGVMIKIALYGLMRLTLDWLGPGPAWWGIVLLSLAAISSVLGVLYAIAEHDLKRLLAYHSVENVGIITLGIGAALVARSVGQPVIASLALVAALFHVMNHALFKSGLFLSAGAVGHAAGTHDLGRLGGLARVMPQTTFAFFILSMAISGLPPFNGFASEWLTFQALLRLAHQTLSTPAISAVVISAVLALALTGGLAAACFVKVCGVGFLGPNRSSQLVREVRPAMRAGPLYLAALCVLLGFVPGLGLNIAGRALVALNMRPLPVGAWLRLAVPWGGGDYIALLFLGAALVVLVAVWIFGGAAYRGATSDPWACGGTLQTASAYTATTYSKLLRQVFQPIYRPTRRLSRSVDVLPYLYSDVSYESHVRHVIDQTFYRPLVNHAVTLARALRRVQSGGLRIYVGYLLATLLILLLLVHR